jgi:hypothetical protein
MKILVTLPQNHKPKDLESFFEAAKSLKKAGHNVFEISSKISAKGQKDIEKSFSQTDKLIKDADILLTEVTAMDGKVGYEIARAIDEKKVVIALESDKSKELNPIIHGNNTRQLVFKKYNSKNAATILEQALREAEDKLDSKFILIIPPEMDRYLNWASKSKRTHKAQLVRSAVEQMMKKDREYKEYNEETV